MVIEGLSVTRKAALSPFESCSPCFGRQDNPDAGASFDPTRFPRKRQNFRRIDFSKLTLDEEPAALPVFTFGFPFSADT